MGLLDRFRRFAGDASGSKGPGDDFWYSDLGASWPLTGMTYERALQLPTVIDCLNVLSQTVAALPLAVFKRRAGGGKDKAEDHPIFRLLHHRPNDLQTAFEFRQQMQWDVAFWRNAYALVEPGAGGPVGALYRLDPRRMTVRLAGATVAYEYRASADEGGHTSVYGPDRIMHLRAAPFSDDGVRGRSVLETSAEVLSHAYALQDFSRRFFENGTGGGERIKPPPGFNWANEESRMNFLRAYTAARAGRNRHKPALLLAGFDVVDSRVNNDEAQFIETLKESGYSIARLWRMPPHKVGLLDKATFSNIEQQALEFVVDTMLPWLVMWEQAIRRDLIADDEVYFAEHNVAGLLRGDIKSRYGAYAVARQWGWLSVNEVRDLENMNPVEGGDERLKPLNMVDLTSEAVEGEPDDAATPAAQVAGGAKRVGSTKRRKGANGHAAH